MSGRPEVLFDLFASLESLPGVGPKTARHFEGLSVTAPRDLLFTLPYTVIDRRPKASIKGAQLPAVLTVPVVVGTHQKGRNKGSAYRIFVSDAETSFQLVFFHARGDYWARTLPESSKRVVSGKVELFDGLPQMVHPDYIVPEDKSDTIPEYEPIYPLTAGVSQKLMSRAASGAVSLVPDLAEWIDPTQKSAAGWPDFSAAVAQSHAPRTERDLLPTAAARERLAYDELLAHQLTLALARERDRRKPGIVSQGTGGLQRKVLDHLPYRPTGAQQRAVEDINANLAQPTRMNRLLQGDVGSGKTLVALMALLRAVEAGGQAVLMAPTEILARQHFEDLSPLAEIAGVSMSILTGRDKGKQRQAKLAALADGELDILLGTHAVFQQDVQFHDLRLAIVDEQHRFGVRQRLELGRKGVAPDVLVMTATPIPRTLALAQYGDMDVSVLDEKPPGRTPIKTALVSTQRLQEVVDRLKAAIAEGRQCYWVCPLVDESETVDLTAAQERFKALRSVFDEAIVGLVHGQMPGEEKDAAMARFQAGQTKVLVATTVIEVGVNVPNATIMVIERAEIFGLAQLHQLRGRVGRGGGASTCLLMYRAPLSDASRRRLELLRNTEDGYILAEEDLKMRGAGDVIGAAQSGIPRFKVADLERQAGLMATAQSDARKLLHDDPTLTTERGRAARTLLWLMRRDESIRLISVG
jgi:ATP-dependent DNA helicase RecG